MVRFVLRYILAPMVLWWGPIFATFAAYGAEDTAPNWVASYFLAAPTLIIAWWGISISRWLHKRFSWGRFPYLLSNIVISVSIFSLSIAVGIITIETTDAQSEELATRDIYAILVVLAGFICGIGWFLRSLWQLTSDHKKKFEGIHWWLIEPDLTPVRGLQNNAPVRLSTLLETEKTKPSAEKPKRRDKSPSSIFRSITITDTRKEKRHGIPIPRRVTPPQQQRTSGHSVSTTRGGDADIFIPAFSFPSPGSSSFAKQARAYADRTGQNAEHIPFMQYWPTYAAMSEAQQRWYFYWRTQLRQGNPLPADTSYLFVYVYEALNLVGFPSPKAAFKRLVSFWKYYRVLQPKLDTYLVDWLADFVVVHKLPTTPLKWYGLALQEGAYSGDIDLSIEAWLATGGDFRKLPSKLLYKLSGYNPTRSKFFKAHSDGYQLEDTYREGLQAIEQSLRDTGSSLFQIYRPSQVRVIQRQPFASALHDLSLKPITLGKVHPWTSREDLSAILTSITKYSENVRRTQAGFSSKLRGIALSEEWQSVLDRAFALPEPRREVTIDMDMVAQLQQESEEVRERLIANDRPVSPIEQESTEKPVAADTLEHLQPEMMIDMNEVARLQSESEDIQARLSAAERAQHSQTDLSESTDQIEISGSSPQPSYTQRPIDAPVDLLTDLLEVAEVMGKSGQTASRLLLFLKDNAWETDPSDIPDTLFQGSFLNTELDEINERAARVLGDALIFEENTQLVVAEDYRDEIEFILDHPDYAEASISDSTVTAPPEKYSELTEDWATFAQQLQPHHWEVLAALISGIDVDVRLNAIARSTFTTANQLVDAINEFAMNSIDDIVVDTETDVPQIEEEDIEGIHALITWASQKALLEG